MPAYRRGAAAGPLDSCAWTTPYSPPRAPLVNSGRIAGVDDLDIETTDALINRGGALASDGTRVTTIPDLWDAKKVGGILEAKDVLKFSRTRQLDGQIALARQHDQPFNLVVSLACPVIFGPVET